MSKICILMYHYTRELIHSRYPQIKGMDISLFRQQVEFLKKNFNFVTMEEVMDAVEGRYDLPNNALLMTFDDGYIDNYIYALPILEEFGVQGSFFIPGKTFATHELLDVNKIHYILACADIRKLIVDIKELIDFYRGIEFDYPSSDELFEKYAIADRFDSKEVIFVKRVLQTHLPERVRSMIASKLFEKYVGVPEKTLAYELYMTEEQIRTMKRHGMFIGLHGYDHYWMTSLSQKELEEDVNKALKVMDSFIDQKRWAINYPYGDYNETVVDAMERRGAIVGLTIEEGIADIRSGLPMQLPRLDCNDFPPKSNDYTRWSRIKTHN